MIAGDLLRYRDGMADQGADRSRLRQITAFVTVADMLSFSRAAELLQTSQPPVSRLIRRLEQRLGVVLFDRDSHSVRLTAAGEELLGPARNCLAAVDAFDAVADGIAAGRAGLLRVGTTEGATLLVSRTLARFAQTHPEVAVRLEQEHTPIKLKRLQQHTLDVAFVRNPLPTPGVRMAEVSREPLFAVVSRTSPLATRDVIDLAELADQPLILTPSSVNSGVRDAVLSLAIAAGFTPRPGPPMFNGQDAIAQVASSSAWTLLAADESRSTTTDVVYLALRDPDATVAVSLAWPSTGTAPAVTGFLRAAREP